MEIFSSRVFRKQTIAFRHERLERGYFAGGAARPEIPSTLPASL